MLPRSPDTDASLQAFRRYARLDHDNYALGSVGDSPEIATELADLVIPEIKRAIASLARDCGEGREPMPRPGDFDMILDGDEHRPRFIWRTTEVTIKPLSQVDEAFAWDEGGTARETGGSMLIAAISPDKPTVKSSRYTTRSRPCSSASRSSGHWRGTNRPPKTASSAWFSLIR